MKVRIEKVDWDLSEEIREGTVTFSIADKNFYAFSCCSDYKVGEIIEVELSQIEAGFDWEETFSRNNQKKKCLINIGNWSYDGYGQIISINPVVVNFGCFPLELGDWTNDKRVIGEYIFWKIDRLDI
ncbi:MAG: hypothetical protein K8T10_11065 [Candidatus Eremiobacteraeota bacterium]|nr:hypothetical protein [Candidatus Eremiobacteraeota bacterium]